MAKIRIIAALASTVCAFGSMGISASAATQSDVLNTLKGAGWSDWMIQITANELASGDYTSEQYDKIIENASGYSEEVERQIWNLYYPDVPFPEKTGSTTETTKPAQNTTSGSSNSGNKAFSEMTFEEQSVFLESMSDSEKRAFFQSLSAKEKASLIEKMSLAGKAELVEKLTETLREFGIFVRVDELSGENITLSTYDENGKLLGVSSMSITVDLTGKSYTTPILIGSGMTLFALTGTSFTLRRKD